MKNLEQPRKKKRSLLLFALLPLLAVVCIGAVELLVCFHQDPALYQRITAPVRAGAYQLAEAGQAAWEQIDRAGLELCQGARQLCRQAAAAADSAAARARLFWEELTAPEPEEEDIQLVDEQAVAPPPRPRAALSVTALEARDDGLDYLTGGAREVVYFDQTAQPWAEEPYGTDPIGGYGCGPTAMAMVVATLAGVQTDPAQMAQYCVDQGYWSKYHGSYWSIVPGVAEGFGLTCTPLPPEEADEDAISRCLVTGDLIVALMGPGHFTNGGHFIVLRGITLDGSVLVADPASAERSLITWDLDLLLEELSSKRHDGGPLWIVSPGRPQ